MISAILAQYEGLLDALDTTGVGAHAVQPAPIVGLPSGGLGKDVIGLDLSTAVTVRLTLRARLWTFVLAYSPSLTASDVEIGVQPAFLNSGNASIVWRDRWVRFVLSEAGSYGQASTTVPYQAGAASAQGATTPGGTASSVPPGAGSMPATAPGLSGPALLAGAPRTIDVGSSSTTASLFVPASRETGVSLSLGYTLAGGLTASARTVLPLQSGPFGSASVSSAPSRRDSLTTTVSGQDSQTSVPCTGTTQLLLCSQEAAIGQLLETYRRRLSRTASISLGGGIAASLIETPQVDEIVLQPVFNLVLSDTFGAHSADTVAISSGLAPQVDLFTGYPSYLFQATGRFTNRWSSKVTVGLSAAAIKSVDLIVRDPAPLTILSGGLDLKWHVDRHVDVVFSLQEFGQRQITPGTQTTATFSSTIGSVSVTGRAPTQRF